MSDVAIAALAGEHHAGLAGLMEQMQDHYKVPCPPREAILAGLSALPPGARCLVALRGEAVVGFCFFSGLYPGPGLRPGLFLKDLYVDRNARGAGTGAALMRALKDIARNEGYARIDFTAAPGNAPLMAFYERAGATMLNDRMFFRLRIE